MMNQSGYFFSQSVSFFALMESRSFSSLLRFWQATLAASRASLSWRSISDCKFSRRWHSASSSSDSLTTLISGVFIFLLLWPTTLLAVLASGFGFCLAGRVPEDMTCGHSLFFADGAVHRIVSGYSAANPSPCASPALYPPASILSRSLSESWREYAAHCSDAWIGLSFAVSANPLINSFVSMPQSISQRWVMSTTNFLIPK
jgi:hypothetical protein